MPRLSHVQAAEPNSLRLQVVADLHGSWKQRGDSMCSPGVSCAPPCLSMPVCEVLYVCGHLLSQQGIDEGWLLWCVQCRTWSQPSWSAAGLHHRLQLLPTA